MIFVLPHQAHAFWTITYDFNGVSPVSDNVSPTSPSSWNYQYTLTNNTILVGGGTFNGIPLEDYYNGNKLTGFYIPYFSDAGITNLTSPTGWNYVIEAIPNNVTNYFNNPSITQVLYWQTTSNGIALGDSLSGFGYDAGYSAAKAPFEINVQTYANGNGSPSFPIWGDPLIPASPEAIAAGLQPVQTPSTAVPEPTTMLLFGLGMLGIVGIRKKIVE
jgi:hypothetical protein